MALSDRVRSVACAAIASGSMLIAVLFFIFILCGVEREPPAPGQRATYVVAHAIVACLMVANFAVGLHARGRRKWMAYLAATICLFAIWPGTVAYLARYYYYSPRWRR